MASRKMKLTKYRQVRPQGWTHGAGLGFHSQSLPSISKGPGFPTRGVLKKASRGPGEAEKIGDAGKRKTRKEEGRE